MSEDLSRHTIRNRLSPEQRNYEPKHGIDAGFLNYRRLYPFIPEVTRRAIEQRVANLPSNMHPHYKELQTDYDYISAALFVSKKKGALTVSERLSSGQCKVGDVVASTDRILGDNSVYSEPRVEFEIHSNCEFEKTAWLRFSTGNIKADTTRMELSKHHRLSYVGIVEEVTPDRIYVAPLVMGAPWLHSNEDGNPDFDMMWTHYEFFENFIEDIDEFSRVRGPSRRVRGIVESPS